jgi:MoxR-like ATPase
VKLLSEPTLAHRIIVNPSARMRGIDSRRVVRDLLLSMPVPGANPDGQSRGRRPVAQPANV